MVILSNKGPVRKGTQKKKLEKGTLGGSNGEQQQLLRSGGISDVGQEGVIVRKQSTEKEGIKKNRPHNKPKVVGLVTLKRGGDLGGGGIEGV